MRVRHQCLVGLLIYLGVVSMTWAAIQGAEVEYKTKSGTRMKGYIAYDDSTDEKRPGILVVHEWWGHNEYARNRARQLAELGYTALAVDMYGNGQQADHPKDAKRLSSAVMSNLPEAKARFEAALQILKDDKSVDSSQVAAIGYCFGGGVVLQMARMGLDLKGVASFHGSLGTEKPVKKGVIKAKIFVANGEADPFTTAEQITAFKKEMDVAKVSLDFHSYANAKHAFTNPDADLYGKKFGLPLEYNAEADKQSWRDMQKFLARIF